MLKIQQQKWKKCEISEKKSFTSESLNGVWQVNELSWVTSEDFGHKEGLRQEFLDFSGSGDCQFIFFTEFVHTQDSNNIL